MTDKITPEVLREFAEKGGWTKGTRLWHHPWCTEDGGCVTLCGRSDPPAFRTNLQACFDVLERVCGERELLWEVGDTLHPEEFKKFYCQTVPREMEADEYGERVAHGPTLNDAIILAVTSL